MNERIEIRNEMNSTIKYENSKTTLNVPEVLRRSDQIFIVKPEDIISTHAAIEEERAQQDLVTEQELMVKTEIIHSAPSKPPRQG